MRKNFFFIYYEISLIIICCEDIQNQIKTHDNYHENANNPGFDLKFIKTDKHWNIKSYD